MENFDADEPIPTPDHEQEYIKMLENLLNNRQAEMEEKRNSLKNLKLNNYKLMHEYNLKCEAKRDKETYG